MFSDFPNLHPLVVHFPVVLLLVAAALQAVLVFKDWQQVRWMALVAMAGGFAGGLAASTIFHAMPKGLPPKAAAIFAAHEQYASYTLWLAGITLLLAGVGEFFQIRRRAYAGLVLASALAAAGAVSVAGHHGAQLVYVEGVGPKGNLVMSEEEEAREEKAGMEGMDMSSPASDKQAGADPKTPVAEGAADKQPMAGNRDMEGMDMSGTTANPPATDNGQTNKPMTGMGNMNMTEKPGPGAKKAAPATASMTDMPGMKSRKSQSKSMANMPGMAMEGMEMPATAGQRAKQTQPAMPGMDMKKGMEKQPAGARKQPPMQGMSGMEGMGDMPGTKAPASGKQPPAPEMGAMPGMGTMPGMTMPSPMDKYRFEDNNPARTIPPRNERKQDN